MKFREQTVTYDIDKHGSAYVDYSAPVYICPECSSTDTETKLIEGCNVSHKCSDCGCEFRLHQVYEITKAGKIIRAILSILITLCMIGIIAGLTVPVGFMLYQEQTLGKEMARELYRTKCAAVVFVVPIVNIIFGSFFSYVHDKI